MRIVFMGTPEFSVPIVDELNKKYEVVLVVTQPDTYQGRKKILTYSPVKKWALENNIKVFQPEKISLDYDMIIAAKPDIIITAAYGQFIPSKILELAPYKAINVHGSLLPRHRGGAPIQRAIMEGDTKTGITIMYMVKKMDAGDIISQRSIDILDTDNNTTLFNKLSILGRDLLMETLPLIFENKIKPIVQDETLVTISPNITHEEQFINWHKDAKEVFNHIRGLSLEPGALTKMNDTIFKIYSSVVTPCEMDLEPGTIIECKKNLVVKCAKDAIMILEIQQAGKNKMDIKSFLNGQKLLSCGCKFEDVIL